MLAVAIFLPSGVSSIHFSACLSEIDREWTVIIRWLDALVNVKC